MEHKPTFTRWAKRQRWVRIPEPDAPRGPVYFGGAPTINSMLHGLSGSDIPAYRRRADALAALRKASYRCEMCNTPDASGQPLTAREFPANCVQVLCSACYEKESQTWAH